MNKKIIVTTSTIAALAVNVMANGVVTGPVEPNTNAPVGFGQMQINGVTHVFAGEQPNSSVSFGSKQSDTYSNIHNYNRQLQNVSAGRIEADSLDAVNGSQLFAAIDEINSLGGKVSEHTQQINHISNDVNDIKTDLSTTTNQVNINTKDIADLKGKIDTNTTVVRNELNNKINATERRINKLGASSAALAGLNPLDFNKNDKMSFAVSYGRYKSQNAVALGAFYRPNEKTMLGAGVSLGSETQITINAAFRVGKGADYVQEAKTDNSRISQLEKLVQSLTAEVAALKNGN